MVIDLSPCISYQIHLTTAYFQRCSNVSISQFIWIPSSVKAVAVTDQWFEPNCPHVRRNYPVTIEKLHNTLAVACYNFITPGGTRWHVSPPTLTTDTWPPALSPLFRTHWSLVWSPIIQPATRATLALPIQNTLRSVRFALVAPGYKLKVRGLNVMKMKMLRQILTFKLMEIWDLPVQLKYQTLSTEWV